MEDLLSYRLADLLLFSEQGYLRQFELYNDWLGTVRWLSYLSVALFVGVWFKWSTLAARVLLVVTACLWLLCSYGYLYQFYAQINWLVAYLIPLCILQALIMLAATVKTVSVKPTGMALLVLLFLLLLQPFVEISYGRGIEQLSAVLLTPDSLALFTLATVDGFACCIVAVV